MNDFTVSLERADPRQPLYEQLYQYISGEILEGRLKEGERLPSKKSLASHLKISANTMETACSMLLQSMEQAG